MQDTLKFILITAILANRCDAINAAVDNFHHGPMSMSPLQDNVVTPPHPSILDDIQTGTRLLVSGGPPNADPLAISAFNLPQLAYLEDMAVDILEEIKHGLRYLFQTNNTHTLAVVGTGSLGIEVALSNIVEPGDTLLILITGWYAMTVKDTVERLNGIPIVMERIGGAFTLKEIEEQISTHKPKIVYAVVGESSYGVYQNVEGLGELCHIHGCITMLDVVHIIGIQPFFMDKWKIDVVMCNSQKGIGAPVGMAPISFSPRAVEKMMNRTTHPATKLNDFRDWLYWNYWKLSDPNIEAAASHSLPTLLLYTLRHALTLLCREGLPARWAKFAQLRTYLRGRLEEEFPFLGDYIEDPLLRVVGTIHVTLPLNFSSSVVTQYLFEKYQIDVSNGWDEAHDKILRIALMGGNSNFETADKIVDALKDAFIHFGLLQPDPTVSTSTVSNNFGTSMAGHVSFLLVFVTIFMLSMMIT